MICIDQQTGQITKEPLLTLSKEFKGKTFGVYLKHKDNDKICTITTGSELYAKWCFMKWFCVVFQINLCWNAK